MARFVALFTSTTLSFILLQLYWQAVIVAGLTKYETNYKRTLSSIKINPNCHEVWCNETTKFPDGALTHVVAKGEKDALHHLFSTVGAPSLMISRTKLDSELDVDYKLLLSPNHMTQAINYTKGAEHSFGIVFSSIYEFDDYKDEANLSLYSTNASSYHRHNLTDLKWTVELKSDDSSTRIVMINATTKGNDTLLLGDGHLSFIIRYDEKDGRLTTRPHMEYTSNSSILTVVMSKFNTRFPNSRFSLELIMFSTDDKAEEWNATQVHISKSLDDEYSPGVFQMKNWLANENKPREDAWGYAQWKPVVYTSGKRLNADLSHATSYPNLPQDKNNLTHTVMPNRSLFYSYFGNDFGQVSLNATNVSFGMTKDKFYVGTNYTVWTVAIGMGPAPTDGISTLVILIISVGLGIPLVLMIASVVYVCARNIRKRRAMKSPYTEINS